MYASNSHSYAHLILALGIVREPTVWVFITSKYPGIHDIGLPADYGTGLAGLVAGIEENSKMHVDNTEMDADDKLIAATRAAAATKFFLGWSL